MTERNQFIDFLKGLAIVVIILTHTTVFFLQDKLAFTLWNYSQFAVPVFIFCSVYLFLKKGLDTPIHVVSYLKKRFVRLLIPYYIFLFFFVICLLVVSPHVVTFDYLIKSIFVIGGVDINWLVLLFLYITVLLPLFVWSFKKAKIIFWLFFLISLGSAIWFMFDKFDYSYKYILWLPWSFMFYFTFFYIKHEGKKNMMLWLFVMSCLLFAVSYEMQSGLGHSLVLRDNKYPPNIFYITYGTAIITLLTLFSHVILSNKTLNNILHFFSRYSYSIYFLHYTILTVLVVFIKQLHFTWLTLFLSVLILTIVLQKLSIWVRMKVSL